MAWPNKRNHVAHPGYRSRRGGSLHRILSATASPAASTCCVEGSPPRCAYDERFDRRPESSSTLRHPIIQFSPCSALSRIRPVQTWSPAVLLVAIRRRIPQDGVVLRWCGERGWKLRGSTGLASSILVAVASFFCTLALNWHWLAFCCATRVVRAYPWLAFSTCGIGNIVASQ